MGEFCGRGRGRQANLAAFGTSIAQGRREPEAIAHSGTADLKEQGLWLTGRPIPPAC